MLPYTLRQAGPSDAEGIAGLAITVWITTYAVEALCPAYARLVMEQFTVEKVRGWLCSPRTRLWVAENERGLLGFAELTLGERTDALAEAAQAELARLYVLERFTGQGVGRALLERCVSLALEAGAARVWLSVYHENQRALGFYHRHGWEKVGSLSYEIEGIGYPNFILANPLLSKTPVDCAPAD